MAVVELTGRIAAWSGGLAEGLQRHRLQGESQLFKVEPPFADADAGEGAYAGLEEYLQTRMKALEALLDDGSCDAGP